MHDEFGELPALETARLQLRKLRREDAADVFAYASDPEVTKYLMWSPHRTIEDSRAFIATALLQYNRKLVGPWAIVHRQDRKVIGTCDFISWHPEHGRAEIGYALSRVYWNRGLMTEAVREIIAYGFRVKRLNRIQALCEIPNLGSARVMEKAGMTFEGILRQYMIQHRAPRDMKIYAMLREEWQQP